MSVETPLQKAFRLCGGPHGLAQVCGVSRPAVLAWRKRGCLPRTEWLPDSHPQRTRYAEKIESAARGMLTRADLLS